MFGKKKKKEFGELYAVFREASPWGLRDRDTLELLDVYDIKRGRKRAFKILTMQEIGTEVVITLKD